MRELRGKNLKRTLCLLLALAMLLSIFPPTALAVLAEGSDVVEMPGEVAEEAPEAPIEPEPEADLSEGEASYVGIEPAWIGPAGVNIPVGATVIPVTTETELRNALAANNPVTAVQLMNDITVSGTTVIPITAGGTTRQVHIFSNTTSIDQAFSINRTAGTTRHINIDSSRQLHLWNVTLSSTLPAGTDARGGLSIAGTA
ncbi:MAG: hypothetical protein FWD84_01635, partial [Oscillospiraceae bacterium]|nr:hypothetical protein [Oscillospiraceae bacterium]